MHAKSTLTELTVKVILSLTVVESLANIVFEYIGKRHNTPAWIAAMIAAGIAVILRATFKEKK